jgi:bacterioferritin-associated ferredoxin
MALRPLHAVGPGAYELAADDTVVCRCEEVTRSEIEAAASETTDLNVVKGLTRAGMGLCQGRICQRQVAATIAARHGIPISSVPAATPRFPVRPVPMAAIADPTIEDEGLFW